MLEVRRTGQIDGVFALDDDERAALVQDFVDHEAAPHRGQLLFNKEVIPVWAATIDLLATFASQHPELRVDADR